MKKQNKLSIPLQELQSAVRTVERCLPKGRAIHPILTNIKLVADGGVFSVTATDLDGAASHAILVGYNGVMDEIVSGQAFARLVASLTEDAVNFDVSDKAVIIRRDAGDITLRTSPSADYPLVTFGDPDAYRFRFEREELAEALKLSGFILNTGEVLGFEAFKGAVSLKVDTNLIESKFEILSTDTAILSFVNGLCEKSDGQEDGELVIPKYAVTHILSILNASDEKTVQFSDDENHIFMNIGNTSYMFRKTTVKFPDMSQAKTTEFPTRIKVNSGDLLQGLKRVTIFADERLQSVGFDVQDDAIVLSCANADKGECEEIVEAELVSGDPFTTRFNIGYLLGTFSRTDADVELGFTPMGDAYAMKATRVAGTVRADFYVQALRSFTNQAVAA